MITNGQTDLLELIQNASEISEGLVRMDAVRRLKQRPLQRMDALALSEFARKAEDPAWRTTAAQVLGFHRVAVSYPDLVDLLRGAATTELDPEARRALVYAVRDTEGAADLIEHPLIDVGLEAVFGLPASETSWSKMLDGYYAGLSATLEARVLRLIGEPAGAGGWVVGYLQESLFESVSGDPSERTQLLFQHLDQGEVFTALIDAQSKIERTHERIWPGLAKRERKRALLELFTGAVRAVGLRSSLAEAMASRTVAQVDFLAASGRTLRHLLRGLSARDGEQLVLVIAHAFDTAEESGKRRLADLMLIVGRELPDSARTVGAVLSDWRDAPPEVFLKIRQARMGIR